MAARKLVQYVAIRSDLSSSLNWPAGAVIAQACHACTAVIFSFKDDPNTLEYTEELDRMHKVVVEIWLDDGLGGWQILFGLCPMEIKVPSEEELTKLSEKLMENKIDYKLWIEQPENYPTCLATKPYPRDEISKFFKKFKLYK